MAVPRPSGWRLNLVLFVLVSSFVACGYLVWHRRAAWHVVETLKASLPSICDCYTPVPALRLWKDGAIFFADTRETYGFPPEDRLKMRSLTFGSSRSAFRYGGTESDPHDHCWNLAAHREVLLPDSVGDRWDLSAGGTRILAMDLRNGAPGHFLVLGLDGSILHERVIPPLAPFKDEVDFSNSIGWTYHYSPEGKFLTVTLPRQTLPPRVRVYDMESDANWSFDEDFGDLSDEGLLWLIVRTMKSDGEGPASVRAVHLRTGTELWRTAISDGVEEVRFLGRNKLAVRSPNEMFSLLDAAAGRMLYSIPKESYFCNSVRLLEIRDTGPETFLLCWGVCSLETGRLSPAKLHRFPAADLFTDGRRALRPGDNQPGAAHFPEIVDIETGRTLYTFESSPPPMYAVQARLAGDRVLTQSESAGVLVWERRHPEGWKGHFHRPEVLVAVFLGAAILVLWANRPRHEHPSQAS